ncbi:MULTISPECIES: hypothetical protein [unclassified Streptomyces]|uniref:hypothetical protein n=1 Tax=unclassified Streptomyces TaxID=2593676 RepID=UPI002DD8FB4C|nr:MULTISPECIES: hypothetical protein [unclassified Streptomyces]WSA96651.1 hypothetical protein OIE63_37695 [Streptomyces sp. NBC_01795]WSB81066.1 hypothetical protein OHB04_38815 [Streptomyces sp. NBC_01775]WSS10724.1 hypothetical protein OG533_01445 [Streptomyces sp. NBC_01186]WSS39419.1 hypothetical protein OG220_01470 [Streptomyces sp. NBC_01187]
MKELVLALVAAVFGLAGTVVGARAAKKGALISAEVTLQQVRDQADVDQAHWLRQQRLQAYEGFLAAWDECLRIIDSVGLPGSSDSPGINPLKEATGRMAERARRIDILGPAEVARAAKELAVSIRRDVDLATKLMELAESQRPAAESITTGTLPAMASAVEAMEEATRQMQELTAEAIEDARVPPGADAMFDAFERAEGLANVAITQAHAGNDEFAVFLEQATALVAELKSNQEAREGIRERFTTAARYTLDSATS